MLSIMIDDLLCMLDSLLSVEKGEYKVAWPSNTFASVWDMRWEGSNLTVQSKWERVIGGVESLLNKYSEFLIEKEVFLSEWKILLKKNVECLDKCNWEMKKSDGTFKEVRIREDAGGHSYPDNPSQNRGSHFNTDDGAHFDYE